MIPVPWGVEVEVVQSLDEAARPFVSASNTPSSPSLAERDRDMRDSARTDDLLDVPGKTLALDIDLITKSKRGRSLQFPASLSMVEGASIATAPATN